MLPLDVLKTRLKNELNLCRKEIRCKVEPLQRTYDHFPLRYRIHLLDIPGPINVEDALRFRYMHQLVITIPRDYPFSRPSLEWETPIFHPNIQLSEDGGDVHLGYIENWTVKSSLAQLLKAVKTLLLFPNLDEVYNTPSCLRALKYFKNREVLAGMDQPDIFIEEEAFGAMVNHCHSLLDEQLEALGFLIGDKYRWNNRTFTVVRDVITDELDTTAVSVRFSDAAFEGLFHQLDELDYDYLLVGWYHSHPGYGCYMSSTDLDTQARMFSSAHQSAVVIDPKALDLKVFALCPGNGYFERHWAVHRSDARRGRPAEVEEERNAKEERTAEVKVPPPPEPDEEELPSPPPPEPDEEESPSPPSEPERAPSEHPEGGEDASSAVTLETLETVPRPPELPRGANIIHLICNSSGDYIVSGTKNTIYCFDGGGEFLWQYSFSGDLRGLEQLYAQKMIIVAAENDLFGFRRDGELLWQFTAAEMITKLTILNKGCILIGTEKGRIYRVDETGTKRWEKRLADLPSRQLPDTLSAEDEEDEK